MKLNRRQLHALCDAIALSMKDVTFENDRKRSKIEKQALDWLAVIGARFVELQLREGLICMLYESNGRLHKAPLYWDGATASAFIDDQRRHPAVVDPDARAVDDGYVTHDIVMRTYPVWRLPSCSRMPVQWPLPVRYELHDWHDIISECHTRAKFGVPILLRMARAKERKATGRGLQLFYLHGPKGQIMRELNNNELVVAFDPTLIRRAILTKGWNRAKPEPVKSEPAPSSPPLRRLDTNPYRREPLLRLVENRQPPKSRLALLAEKWRSQESK